jgi:hypothetical protein
MLRAGLYSRVSTSDQQTLAMQNRAMGSMPCGGAGQLPDKSGVAAASMWRLVIAEIAHQDSEPD